MISKLPHVGTTIFTTMSQMAAKYQAINLSQGFPNFPVDANLIEILKETVVENVHQYAPMAGNNDLLEELAKLTFRSYQRKVEPAKEILVTAGATQGIFTTIQALIQPGDEVIVLDPSYDCYAPAVILAGGKPVHINLKPDFTTDWDRIDRAMTEKTKMIVVNNPHNPTGKTLLEKDIQQLEEILDRNPQVILLSDEVYEYISFENKHISANTREKLREKSVIVSSFGKTFHITGWKVGYLIAPEKYLKEIKKVHQFLVFSVNSIAQVALTKHLQSTDVSVLGDLYQEKRDYFRSLISESRFELLPSEGTYFQVVRYANISTEPDLQFAERLVKENGIATVPMSAFYANQFDNQSIRLCFAKDNETLEKAAEKLCQI